VLNVSSPVTSLQRFHLALPVDDLSSACEFYETRLNCPSLHREDSEHVNLDWTSCSI
jgi:extradiol dioxygenase family protein